MTCPENWKFYNSKRWKHRRKQQLQAHPLCVLCLQGGRITAATVADHVIPHRGNAELFYHGDLQSLCDHCHNKTKKDLETIGYTRTIGLDGWPTHPNHPANRTI
jgi:5-methylcytosine-specific restriction enzyme A